MSTSTTQRRSIVHTPGSPSDLKGIGKARNPDGKTPADLPTGKPKSLHDQKPPALVKDEPPTDKKPTSLEDDPH